MAVYYKVYQNNRKNNPNKGKWYARAAMVDTDTTDDLAKKIMEKCTVNEADVIAVVKALVGEITTSLQASHRVKLPGFGTFKLGINTKPADSRKDFSATDNVKGVHVVFQPELKISGSGVRTRAFINGAKLRELSSYDGSDTDNASADNAGSTGGGSQSGDGEKTNA